MQRLQFKTIQHQTPQRIVSLDYCADQYVLALADRNQIAALSRGSRRDDSYSRDRARGIRQTRGTLEDVLPLHPDLIVRNWGGPWDAEQVYARFRVPVLQVGDAPTFAAARTELQHAAAALGRSERGELLVRDLDLRLARLAAAAPHASPPVIYISSGGAVAGRGTMMASMIEAAGGRNAWSGENWSVLPLERFVQAPPAFVATGFLETGRTRMNAWSPSRHPVFQRMLARTHRVDLQAGAISCQAWTAIDAAEMLGDALRRE